MKDLIMPSKTTTGPDHLYETELVDEAASATSGRLPYDQLLAERACLLKQAYLPAADKAPNPILFFGQTRQLLHANEAALRGIIGKDIMDAIGLRLGELFGCDHKMSSLPGETYRCQDCNSMPSLRTALEGRQGMEIRQLLMHPTSTTERAVYRISSVPMSAGERSLAMMMFEKMDDPNAV
jgi:hypothetical protein